MVVVVVMGCVMGRCVLAMEVVGGVVANVGEDRGEGD
jgi:hypothetical protein